MTAFEAVAFDYDGTLFDTRARDRSLHPTRFRGMCGPADTRALTPFWIRSRSGIALQDTFLILDEALRGERAALQELVRTYRTFISTEGTPLLKPFAGAGGGLAGASRTWCQMHRYQQQRYCSNSPIARCKAGSVPSSTLVLGDEPGIAEKAGPGNRDRSCPAQISANCEAEQILMVGDTEIDILFAQDQQHVMLLGVLWIWRSGALPGAGAASMKSPASGSCRRLFAARRSERTLPAAL